MASESPYIVSARKYRPATFKTVVGQRALTATLKNAISEGKLAQAYLFCGPRGVGKTSCARIFAKTINCLNPTSDGEACGECESCKAIDKGNSFNLVELDAASNNSVDDIRNITEQVNIPAQDGRYRVFIIDEVHMLSNSAFNAFLKTLEEPPKNVVFILATTERHKVIPTILSRCQVYDFRRITINDIVDHLQYVADSEGVTTEKEALGVIALKADGAMRDALSIFDQVVASTQGNVRYRATLDALNVLDEDYYFRLVDMFRQGDVAGTLLTFKEITDKGFDAQFFVNGLASHIRNLMVSADPRTVSLLETSEEQAKKYQEQAPSLPAEWYYNAIKILNDTDFNYRTSGNKRLLVELALIRLSRLLTPFVVPEGNKPQSAPEIIKREANNGDKGADAGNRGGKVENKVPGIGNKGSLVEEKSGTGIENKGKDIGISGAGFPDKVTDGGEKGIGIGEKRPAIKPQSFRLSDTGKSGKASSIDKQKNPFGADDFKRVWDEYAALHSDQRILVAAMRASTPEKIDDITYRVCVEHPAQKQAFESAVPELLEYFKDRLKNDFVALKVEISEKEETNSKMAPREFLKMAVDENPELAKFLKAIDAELE